MSYVAYHKDTTRYLCRQPKTKVDKERFASAGAAKAAITREAKRGVIVAEDFLVAEFNNFHSNIEKFEEVQSLMAKPGAPSVKQRVNTPWCCNPASETYWAM